MAGRDGGMELTAHWERQREDSEHDSLGMGLCTFDTRLHANVARFDRTGIGPG